LQDCDETVVNGCNFAGTGVAFSLRNNIHQGAGKEGGRMQDSDVVLVGTDQTWREQFMSTFRRSEFLEPEKALLAALLQDAIDCYHKYALARDREGRELLREAEHWIMTDQDDWVFSFRNVCSVLGVDAEYVRRGVLEESARQRLGSRRRYKHRRHAA
jgi:hypothetical protein